ncbi:hypothetical protein ACMA5I_13790 [Paracoccaceae bacterium GXU_MW_L88]
MKQILALSAALAVLSACASSSEMSAEQQSDSFLEVLNIPPSGPVSETVMKDGLAAMRAVPRGYDYEDVLVEGRSEGRLLVLVRATPETSLEEADAVYYRERAVRVCVEAAEGRPAQAMFATYPDGGYGAALVCDNALPLSYANANIPMMAP